MSSLRMVLTEINLALTLAAIILWVVWMRKNKKYQLYGVPVILWLLSLGFFYVRVLIFRQPADEFHATWSSAIRLQALLTILLGVLVMLKDNEVRK
jgi:prolipoprotein diacylglyceryltransferase